MAGIAGKSYAVTGGASGMGLATSRSLAKLKAKAIYIGDFNTAAFEGVRKDLESISSETKIFTTKVDVSSRPSVDEWFAEIEKEGLGLDGVVACAGVAQKVGQRKAPGILEETDETWERTMGVNLNGVFFTNRAAIKNMVALPKGPRAIVNISSMAALIHSGDCYAYATSKRGVVGLTTAVAKDVLPFGIRVNGIMPSATKTPMLGQFFDMPPPSEDGSAPSAMAGFDMIEPEDIAQVAIWLLSDDSNRISGVNIPVGATAP